MMITQMFSVCNYDEYDTLKTWTIANQFEIPIEQYISVICFSSIGTKSKKFMSHFVVADTKNVILGTSFFEKNLQNITIKV